MCFMITEQELQNMNEEALRSLAKQFIATIGEQVQVIDQAKRTVKEKEQIIAKLTFELAYHRKLRYGRKSEHLTAEQRQLFEESMDTDLAAIGAELDLLKPAVPVEAEKRHPRRMQIPANLPRTEIHHEPASTQCACGCQLKRIGEDVSEKLDYAPGLFSVERHVRGKWACTACQTITQAPVPAHIIDKGLPTTGLLAHVLVGKFADHLPLYRQEHIFARAGVPISRQTLADWVGACGVQLQPLVDALKAEVFKHDILHADETPVNMLKPDNGKTHRAYIWAYSPGQFERLKAVIYDFTETRAGKHAREFLGDWQGSILVDDFAGYNALFTQGITELGCMAHARRKFHDLYEANGSEIAQQALVIIAHLYDIERETRAHEPDERWRIRQAKAKPIMEKFHAWLTLQRSKATNGTAIARALDYTLRRWDALVRYLDNGQIPIDNNHVENRIRPIAIGRNNWLFAGSLRAGQRAAAAMSLIQSAKLNGHDPYAYLKDVMTRLPTQPYRQINDLLPHNWQPQSV